MLNIDMLIKAIGQADDEFIEEARLSMGYGAGRAFSGAEEKAPAGRGIRIFKVALIAAVLASLFAIAAYAAGWFGFSARLTPPEESSVIKIMGEEHQVSGYISMNGYAESPEALAHAEWTAFCEEYRQSTVFSNETDTSWCQNAEEENYYYIYGAFDRAMMDKLLEIQEKYSVRLHDKMASPLSAAHFYKSTGLEPFAGSHMNFQCHYIFEDGSFKGEGWFDGHGGTYTLVRGARGVLDPAGLRLLDVDDFSEWQYESGGTLVNIALDSREANGFIFCEAGDYIVTLLFSLSEPGRESAERFADEFDFAALAEGDISLEYIHDTAPTEIKPKEGLLTIADFAETPEYKASAEFVSLYAAYCNGLPENEVYVDGFDGYNYFGGFPTGIEEIDAEFPRITEEYGLLAPSGSEVITFNMRIPPDILLYSLNAFKCDPNGKYPEVSDEEYFAELGLEDFTHESRPLSLVKYDNGAFLFVGFLGHGNYSLHYIPKGCFYPLFKGFWSTEVTSWAYESACGEQVYISTGEQPPYPKFGQRSIIYETDMAYVILTLDGGQGEAYEMEALADEIDFTVFK